MSVRLEGWGLAYRPLGPYRAPELASHSLVGIVTGHPRKSDGTRVITSPILEAQGRTVRTRSGTVYELGTPSPDYRPEGA